MDWLDLLAIQGTLKSLLQHHSSKASTLQRSAFFTIQLSHPYMTTGKTMALTRWTLVGKVMSLVLNIPSRLVITFLPRSKRLLISWLHVTICRDFGARRLQSMGSWRVGHDWATEVNWTEMKRGKGLGVRSCLLFASFIPRVRAEMQT